MADEYNLDSSVNRRDPLRKRRKIDTENSSVLLDRISSLEESHKLMEKTITKIDIVVENSISLIERFENTLDRMTMTLGELNTTIAKINGDVRENTKDINGINSSINEVKSTMRVIEDRGKIDFLVIIKENFAKVVLGGGALGFILYYIDHLIDSWLLK
jgi:uncharacterized coiled-coil protein SlyX